MKTTSWVSKPLKLICNKCKGSLSRKPFIAATNHKTKNIKLYCEECNAKRGNNE